MFRKICWVWSLVLVTSVALVAGCKKESDGGASAGSEGGAQTGSAGGAADATSGVGGVKLSQYDKAQFCDVCVTPDGTIHAVYNEAPVIGKAKYLYYRASTDGGTTWSPSKNLSDDESGNDASYARIVPDAKGRVYAVWKSTSPADWLDGPGGAAVGKLFFRCLENGGWSSAKQIGDEKLELFSYFVAPDPAGAVHVVWSQAGRENGKFAARMSYYADLTCQAKLDGTQLTDQKDLITPKHILTQEEQDALHAQGKNFTYEETVPRQEGLWNLRGYIDNQGVAHFVAEDYGIKSGPSDQQTGSRIVHWDGKQLTPVYEFERSRTYNNFNNPPFLLRDAQGKEHLVRAPEKAEKASVRDYSIGQGKLIDPVEAIAVKTGTGTISVWQAAQLPGGKMAIMAVVSEKGGYREDDAELYVTFSEGGGKWSEPIHVTNVSTQGKFNYKETGAGSISTDVTYRPMFAAIAMCKDGRPGVLMVNNESTLFGVGTAAVTGSGRAVMATGGGRVDSPQVFFKKL